ncbi:MAG: MFS transporter, partial [Sphingomonadales bacterium]
TVLSLAIVAVVGFVAFVVWELTEEHPVVDLRIFRHRGFTIAVLCFTLGFSSYYAGIIVIPQWLQVSLGYSATDAGYATCVSGLAALTMSQFPPRLMKVMDPRLIVTGGLVWLGCSTLMRTEWTSQADFWTLLIPQLIMGFSIPFFFNTLITMMFANVQPHEQPSAAGLFAFMRTMGLAFAASLSLTYWDNQTKVAGAELAGKVHDEATTTALSASGFSFEQSRLIIARLVEQEAITLATDKIFLVTGIILILISSMVWFVPVPKFLQRPR